MTVLKPRKRSSGQNPATERIPYNRMGATININSATTAAGSLGRKIPTKELVPATNHTAVPGTGRNWML